MKTIAQELGIKEFPYEIKDKQGRVIYYEEADGFWSKKAYDSRGNLIYLFDSDGSWMRQIYDDDGNLAYFELPKPVGVIRDLYPKDDIIILDGEKYKRIDESTPQKA
jgi:YD repeat-containing protein